MRFMKYYDIIINKNTSYALRAQKMWEDNYEFPFTCNPTIGCFFKCKYCYLQQTFFSRQAKFGIEVKVKTGIVRALEKDLKKYSNLPQHLKRVQLGNATEIFHPSVLSRTKKEVGVDLISGILTTFNSHWNAGNKWMVHIVTKSHLIMRYVEILKRMKQQIQVEMTIVSPDESLSRLVEPYAPSVGKRLKVIESLAKEGIFVRVMAMPWMHGEKEALEFRKRVVDLGARGFKHKGLNYFDISEMLKGNADKVKKRKDIVFDSVLLNSGEHFINGQQVIVKMPQQKDKEIGKKRPDGWKRLTKGVMDLRETTMPILNSGYLDINNVDWAYLK
jgi:DNA repair photolyase